MEKKKRIFIGYLDHCSYFSSVLTGLRDIGCEAHLLHRGAAASTGWSADQLPLTPRYYYRAYKHFWSTREFPRLSLRRLSATANVIVSQVLLLCWMVLKIDAVILKSGDSIYANAFDIKVLRFFRKTIVFFFVGSDSRPPYLAGTTCNDDELDALHEMTQRIHTNLKKVEHLADFVIANPLSSQFHTGAICIAQMIGNTVDLPKLKPGYDYLKADTGKSKGDGFRVLHAPSMPALKGSDRIRAAIETLSGEGFPIEYVEITGRPHGEVMVELAKCDLVIDELYSDSHAGVLAVEACAFGKPVVVCGYGTDELDRLLPPDATVPTIFQHPDLLVDTVRDLLVDEIVREEAGRRAGDYFLRLRPGEVAKRFLTVINRDAPQDWFVQVGDIQYTGGVCGPIEQISDNVRRYVAKFGDEALLLDDKPELKRRVLDLAFRSDPEIKKAAVANES